MRMST